MSGILTYISVAVLMLLALINLRKDWTAHRSPIWRCTAFTLILVSGAIGIVTQNIATKHSNAERAQHSTEIAGLNAAVKGAQDAQEQNTKAYLEASERLSQKISDLQSKVATKELRREVADLQSELKNTQKALSPPKAQLVMSIAAPDQRSFGSEVTLARTAQGTVSFEFLVLNNTDVNAKEGDVWIRLCDGCKFHSLPAGFKETRGQVERERYAYFDQVPPHVKLENVMVEIDPPDGIRQFEIFFRYACVTCVVEKNYWPQKATIHLSN